MSTPLPQGQVPSFRPLLDDPTPDFAQFERVLRGESPPTRVHLIELGIDPEILELICDTYLGEKWSLPRGASLDEPDEQYYRQLVTLYCRLGYDYVPVWPLWQNHPAPKRRRTADTAHHSRGVRAWVDEGDALLKSWHDFQQFPWDAIVAHPATFQAVARHLPFGMKMVVSATLFEHVFENLLGYEGLAYLLHDDPRLVAEVFQRWGQKVYDFYRSIIPLEAVGAIFHADDMGYKTSTLIAPGLLRRHLFPWLREYADLAHAHGKLFCLHSCGNLYRAGLVDILIDDVGIDGFHSFEEAILPIQEFKLRYGSRVAALGGVDVDRLARLDEDRLRAYVREILDRCMPYGRFALGSGNTVTNYVPVSNYFVLLEESRRWQPA